MLRQGDLAQYITASAALHCIDGWSYLGRAIDAVTHGDSDSSRHLAYYAELRAALSLLAAEGIGIFNQRNFVVESAGTCSLIPRNRTTHEITWLALEYWANLRRSSRLIGQIVNPGGTNLGDWLDAFGVGPAVHPLGRRWLKTWGLDLRLLSEDRDARNEASYRPSRIRSRAELSAFDSALAANQVWEFCEPATSRFETLDRYLLRRSLETLFTATTQLTPSGSPDVFESRILQMLDDLTVDGSEEEMWVNFLTRRTDSDDAALLVDADEISEFTDPRHHLQVISRATLLLRVATGASARLLSDARINTEDLKFWWEPLGRDRGLWPPADPPEELIELWNDADTARKDFADWRSDPASADSFYDLRRRQANAIAVLSECERIAFWGLGL
jgi:hypothetical protein